MTEMLGRKISVMGDHAGALGHGEFFVKRL